MVWKDAADLVWANLLCTPKNKREASTRRVVLLQTLPYLFWLFFFFRAKNNIFQQKLIKNDLSSERGKILALRQSIFIFFFYFPTHDWLNNHLKHQGRSRLGVLIRPVWLWHHFHLVYWWRGSNPRSFDREPSSLPTRPQLHTSKLTFAT